MNHLLELENELTGICGRPLAKCSASELYYGLLSLVQQKAAAKEKKSEKKKLYYLSAEFLIGKLLSNNLINLGLYQDISEILSRHGKSLAEIEALEPEPSLGNGGLGRLAACFLDSIATLDLNGDGIGLNYHFGLFRQVFRRLLQHELPNPWIKQSGWLIDTGISYEVKFPGLTLTSRLYDLPVTGYHGRTNRLRLFDLDSVDESIVEPDSIAFDKQNIEKNLTLFLYPDDSDEAGHLLRIYQQYFMVSSGAQLILDECIARGSNLYDLADYAVIQINDTHPTMIIPELIRLLTEKGLGMDDAIEAVQKTCAYTNHTILAEALEKWPISYLKQCVPQLVPIIEILDDRVRRRFESEAVAIIGRDDVVHMAHLDLHYGFAVNGVAALHTEILKANELNDFYRIYPEKFSNKTNGITFRRWLLYANPKLSGLITALIGDGFKTDASQLEKLAAYQDDEEVLSKLAAIKHGCKKELAGYLNEKQSIKLDPGSLFDIQIKRLHEYKRQQLNALYLIHQYLEIKKGNYPPVPITAIFGAKAAPAYTIAKDIIHLLLCLQSLTANDPQVSPWLRVVMVENYNVTLAEKLIPACDLSEQISLASKEASGTGNMKFMLNGAVTLGTEDGANVEIHQLVGDENIYIFGASSDTVIDRYQAGSYCSASYYAADPALKAAVDFITGSTLLAIGSREHLERLSRELLKKDWFMTFPDFADYVKTKNRALADYQSQPQNWARKMLMNISKAGFFSSDRTIAEYNRDIWRLK